MTVLPHRVMPLATRTAVHRSLHTCAAAASRLVRALESLQPPALLAARLYVAQAFFQSGLTKLRDWDTTLALFADEYQVPLLPTDLAALLGTGGELVLPVLLALGLFGRFAALGLFVVNLIAVLSLKDVAPAALQQHQFWGSLLVGLLLWGPGRWSVDALWVRWLAAHPNATTVATTVTTTPPAPTAPTTTA